jgi:CHAT domain-containing protein/tetratricopeptide (TPR) repeat protein
VPRFGVFVAAILMSILPCWAQSSRELLREGFQNFQLKRYEPARLVLERALELSQKEGDKGAEAEARRLLGHTFVQLSRYQEARTLLEQALPYFQSSGNRMNCGRIITSLALVEWTAGNRARAADLYRKALQEYEAAGDKREQAWSIYSLAFSTPPSEERTRLIQDGLERAHSLKDDAIAGKLLHLWSDTLYLHGDTAAAAEKLDLAIQSLERANAAPDLALALTSLGRIFRFHGHPERALETYRRVLRIQEQTGNKTGAIQTIDAMGVASHAIGNGKQERAYFRKALALARQIDSPGILIREITNLAAAYNESRQYARALILLQEANRLTPELTRSICERLSETLLGMERYPEALQFAEKTVELARRDGRREAMPAILFLRAEVKEKLGRTPEALNDLREGLLVFEEMRKHLIPTDYMKGGYTAKSQELFSAMIEMLFRSGTPEQALEIAEQGRARAFIDLLASRDIDLDAAVKTRPVPSSVQSSAAPFLWNKWDKPGSELPSLVSARTSSFPEIAASAGRLNSTLVSYWVGREMLSIWVVRPGAPVRATQVKVSQDRLRELVLAGTPAYTQNPGLLSRGDEGSITIEPKAKNAYRELYKIAIQPIRRWLPDAGGSRLTIVTHGLLTRISFAALLDENSRYLVEKYSIHYVPAATALDFTIKARKKNSNLPRSQLLIANPSNLPQSADGSALPALPGTLKEIEAITQGMSPDTTVVLTGDGATSERVRNLAPGRTWMHFATHSVLRDDKPFDTFLALANRGRLTVREIHDMDLAADLVFLSACRTGSPALSGDGISGLTRAFFYAGASSVVASLWDIADDPSHRLVSEFYASLRNSGDKDAALRAAQLRLISMLREGKISVATPVGTLKLPEHPFFWAGFVLHGEP